MKTPKKAATKTSDNSLKTIVENAILSKAKNYVKDIAKKPKGDKPRPKTRRLVAGPEKTFKLKRQKHLKKLAKADNDRILSQKQQKMKELSLEYLSAWKSRHEGSDWKFKKLLQEWLIDNMYSPELLSKDDFKRLKKYLKELKGAVRTRTVENAEKIYKSSEAEKEKPDAEITDEVKTKYRRSRSIIKLLV